MVGKSPETQDVKVNANGFKKVPLPPDLQRPIPLSDNARTILSKRYLRRGDDGQPVETEQEMFWRVAYHVAKAEAEYDSEVEPWARRFYDLLTNINFLPNSPTFTGAGTPLGQLAACFTADMRVNTAHGLKRMADLAVGDRVLTHQGRYRPVTELHRRAYDDELLRIKFKLIGTTMEVTPEHPILTPNGWVNAGDLKVGDTVAVGIPQTELAMQAEPEVVGVGVSTVAYEPASTTVTGNGAQPYYKVEQIESVPFAGTVYNCEVDEDHTYVVEGVVVHNCFVLRVDDDMGRTGSGIFETLRHAALIQQTGGGNGFAFSRLRPKGALVKSSSGQATGPVGFLRVYDQAFGEIAQGGSRRGANMAVLRVDHPDIREFITCKTDENAITNFNISVGVTDAFMRAVQNDTNFDLVNPQNGEVWETVRARELFDQIVKQAHHNGEPGVLFLDAANRENPVPHLYDLESTNPCGEQFLGPFENCCLGSINLANHITPGREVNWEKLRESVETSTRFLEDVVTANQYVPAVPQLAEAAHRVRRIGLGIMGLADMMYALGVRYGSREGQEFAGQVMEFVRFHTMRTSIDLARERGPFPAITGSRYDPDNLQWQPPRPLVPYTHDWGRPALDWSEIVDGIQQHGIRNGAQLTVAPTGTISTVAGCEGYGCEPVFALAYMRYVNDNGQQLTLQYTSPQFERTLRDSGLDDRTIKDIVEQVNLTGTCQDVEQLPPDLRRVFVVSSDVTADEHVRMQAALQAFTDNAISKTINFPAGATEDEVRTAYQLGWELGCKGMTVYVTGSRDKVVLETAETKKQKTGDDTPAQPIRLFNEDKKPRPRYLPGKTYRVQTPLGTTYVTINENGEGAGHPFEVFMHTAKAGSDTAAVSEAVGRLISYTLRISSPVSPRKRLIEIVRQLRGIGGIRAIGFGPMRVSSLPDGVAQVLQEYLDESAEAAGDTLTETGVVPENQLSLPLEPHKLGDLCPECGAATLVNEEGCRKCYSCGFSEC
ncbi:MAG: adenosylcobalamin-dependent ribonucleoside-diphosphate reductase [Chloroflexi bacterium]|nr:adenosylcobalamin-dependent ribonucleoside-diphosphate reductase [Chloroflexota bacterium]